MGCTLLLGLACYVVITWTEFEEFLMIECGDVYVVCLGGSMVVRVPLLEDVGRYRCKSGVLLEGVVGLGVALGIGVGAGLSSHFLRKWLFLSVILSDSSTLIRYC